MSTPGREARSFVPISDSRPEDSPWTPLSWPIAPGVALHGNRVRLRRLDPAVDAAALFAALDHDAVWTHVAGRPREPKELEEALLVRHHDFHWQQWLVLGRRPGADLPADAVIGMTSYLDASVPDARLEIGATAYHPTVWGTTVNRETKLLLLAHAFDQLGAGRVQFKTDVRNVRAQRAIASLGARCEGTLRRYRRRSDGSVRDTVLFAVTIDDWPAVKIGMQRRVASAPQ